MAFESLDTSLHPILLAFLGTLFTWAMTAAGASVVFFTVKVNQKLMDCFYGLAAGVMISASCFGLLIPSVKVAEEMTWSAKVAWVPAAIGFILGVAFLMAVARYFFPHHKHDPHEEACKSKKNETEKSINETDIELAECPSTERRESSVGLTHSKEKITRWCCGPDISRKNWRQTLLLITAITLHNFPEGLAVGVAFGVLSVSTGTQRSTALSNAIGLALGIGIQNFPEGLGVSVPLRREGMSRLRSFVWGQFSGTVEIIGGIVGAGAVIVVEPLLPWALSFAAGAMMFVVIEELIPESQSSGNKTLGTIGTVIGFVIMMCLDIALG